MRRILREALFYLLAFALVVLSVSAVCLFGLRASYAGVSDEGIVEAGVAAHADYLRAVGAAAGRLLAIEIPALATLSFGIWAFWWGRREPERRAFVAFGRNIAVALVVHLAWLGAEARRHPGLFLPLLSASQVMAIWLGVARLIWPLVIGLSIAGWIRLVVSSRSVGVRCFGAAGAVFAMAWFWCLEVDPREPAPWVSQRSPVSAIMPASLASSTPRPVSQRRPNVLLIGVDSLRPDKIDPRTTPALARLCKESIYFPNALVTLPRTAPSWVALLTSLPPLANGVETMFPTSERSRLNELAMPAHLASLGYATHVVSEYAGEFFDRVSLGFERRSVPRVELEQILGQALLARVPPALAFAGQLYARSSFVSRFLPAPVPELLRGFASFSRPNLLGDELFAGTDAARPWFALVFYSQPHFPYTSSSPYYDRYRVPGSDPALRFGKDVTRGEVRTDADRAQVEGLYRAALAETDAAVGRVMGRLESTGVLDDTLVILTADHGEGLYECPDCVGHGDNLTGMMTLRVPLAFRLPRTRFPAFEPATVESYVSQLDVYPTVLRLLGIERPPIQEGIALVSEEGRAIPLPDQRVFFAETGEWLWPTPAVPAERIEYPAITSLASVEGGRIVVQEEFLPVIRAAKHRVALRPPWKLVYRPAPKGVAWSLFDIDADPFDTRDLSNVRPDVAAELKAALTRSVLRFSHIVSSGDYFLTRPPSPPEEYY